jgi:hypothetical protein
MNTAVCRHCKKVITTAPDLVVDDKRKERMLTAMGMAMARHLQQRHPDELAQVGQMGALFNGWLVLNQFTFTEPALVETHTDGRAKFAALFAEAPAPTPEQPSIIV